MEKSAEVAEAARRAGDTGVEAEAGAGGAGRVGGGRLQRSVGEGFWDARSPLAHPARTVFALAKAQRLYRSRSDPPNWLLMTP